MADFEGLILKALASQNATDPAVRQHVYQSSRNALERMLAKNPGLTEPATTAQRQKLEESIGRIETGFLMETRRAAMKAGPDPADDLADDLGAGLSAALAEPEPEHAPDPEPDHVHEEVTTVAESYMEPAPQPEAAPQAEPQYRPAPAPEPVSAPRPVPQPTPQPSDLPPQPVQGSRSFEPRAHPQMPPQPVPRVPETAHTSGSHSPGPEAPAYVPPAPQMPESIGPEETGSIVPPYDQAVNGATAGPASQTAPAAQPEQTDEDFFDDDWGALFAPDGSPEIDIPLPDLPDPEPVQQAAPQPVRVPTPQPPTAAQQEQYRPAPEPVRNEAPPHTAPPAPARTRSEPGFETGPAPHQPDYPPQPQMADYAGQQAQYREAPQYQDAGGYPEPEAEAYPVYKRKHPLLRRLWPIALAIAVILVILWLLYALFTNMEDAARTGTPATNGASPADSRQDTSDGSFYITLLEPTDLSALTTAGRGSAELVNEQNMDILRIQSLRETGAKDEIAEPIVLKLNPGVIKQIAGKDVTVEIRAKSGSSGPATFAIECKVDGANACGRKRFRVGLQPEDIVFALRPANGFKDNSEAWLAINTDVTSAADISGAGEAIDIIYSRIRVTNP